MYLLTPDDTTENLRSDHKNFYGMGAIEFHENNIQAIISAAKAGLVWRPDGK